MRAEKESGFAGQQPPTNTKKTHTHKTDRNDPLSLYAADKRSKQNTQEVHALSPSEAAHSRHRRMMREEGAHEDDQKQRQRNDKGGEKGASLAGFLLYHRPARAV